MADVKNNNRPPMGPGGPGHGPRGMRGPGGKPKNAKAAIGRIFSYIKNDVPLLVIVLICVLTNTACSLAGSYLLRPIINNLGDDAAAYISAASSSAQAEILANGVSALLKGLLLMMTVYMFSLVCSYAQSRIMVSISQRAIRNMRNDLFTKMQELPTFNFILSYINLDGILMLNVVSFEQSNSSSQ